MDMSGSTPGNTDKQDGAIRLTKRIVESATPSDGDYILWDRKVSGFGVRIGRGGTRSYVLDYRLRGARKRIVIGQHGRPWTVEAARDEAIHILGTITKGADPATERKQYRIAPTVTDAASRYIKEHVKVHNKPSTAVSACRLVEVHIKPKLGKKKVADLTRRDIRDWHYAMRDTPRQANHALAVLSKILSLCHKDWEWRKDNPAVGVKRYPEVIRERFLSDHELSRLGQELAASDVAGSEMPGVVGAIRLLALTGARRGEILALLWTDVDLSAGCFRLRDAKAGARPIPLGKAAISVLDDLPRHGPYVVYGTDPEKPLSGNTLEHAWRRILTRAGLTGVRLHDLRHGVGTFAAQAGANSFAIRDLLGHKSVVITSRYVNRDVDPLRSLADAVSGRIATALGEKQLTP